MAISVPIQRSYNSNSWKKLEELKLFLSNNANSATKPAMVKILKTIEKVADYSSNSSSEDNSDSDSESENNKNKPKKEEQDNAPKLPPPEFGPGTHLTVFSNPFVEAEKAKKAILEKHVKMTPTKEETTMINGKRICWNYRKGRCRYGHNCKFAHDSDLHKKADEFINDNLPEQAVLAKHEPSGSLEKQEHDEDAPVRKKKKRPGLGDSIVPGKKVMKMYQKQKK